MTGERHEDRCGPGAAALDMVYAASTPDELGRAYAAWAATYDTQTAALGYYLPFQITAWVARYVPAGDGPLLDAGCGTGLSGPALCALGYDRVEGLDLSDEMLRIAAGRGAYARLRQSRLGDRLPWRDGYFRAFLSAGVFTIGHAPASSLFELVRITASGGHAIFTVRDECLETGGFRDVIGELELRRRWRLVEEAPWLRAFAVAEPDAHVKPFVFEIL